MIDLIKLGMDRNAELIGNVKQDQFADATPCADFDVKALLNHIIGGNLMLAKVGQGQAVEAGGTLPDLVGTDPVSAYKESADVAFAAWNDPAKMGNTFTFPFGEMSGPQAFGTVLLETWMHGWDLAKATGQDTEIPAPIAEAMLAGITAGGFDEFRTPEGHPFGPAVTVADDASATDKFVAFLGRTP